MRKHFRILGMYFKSFFVSVFKSETYILNIGKHSFYPSFYNNYYMNKIFHTQERSVFYVSFLVFFLCFNVTKGQGLKNKNVLHLTQSAANWNEAFPVGNGRLGGMVYGGVDLELIKTNDDTFWSGQPVDVQRPNTYNHLKDIRQALKIGDNKRAQELIDAQLLGPYNQSYMPLADISLKMLSKGNYVNYRRELDLDSGIVRISYKQNGINYKREIFASYPDQSIIIRLIADKKKAISFVSDMQSLVQHQQSATNNQLIINGTAPKHVEPNYQGKHEPIYENGHGMRFQGRLLVTETDGKVFVDAHKLEVNQASYVTLIFVAATSFNGFEKDPYIEGKDENMLCNKYASDVSSKKFAEIKKNHVKDYQKLFKRVDMFFEGSSRDSIPLDRRIKLYSEESDPELTALYYQFGRYLLISSSREGSQPANLQGIWNDLLQPAWSANWTINCNAQINYWPVESANLSECHSPLFQLIRDITIDGRKTAKNLYNSRGWVAHHNVDIWRTTWPVGGTGLWALYQVGGAWLCQHIWQHYLFTNDEKFLKDHYSILKEASIFYMDNLQENKLGYLVTSPSISFENHYVNFQGEKGWVAEGASQDMQIIYALFKNTLYAARRFDNDKVYIDSLVSCLDKLPPLKISPTTGQLQEWQEDWSPFSPDNGQLPHGWGLICSDQINLHSTPELANALRKTLEARRPEYTNGTGSWTAAFAANYWAKLEDPVHLRSVFDMHFDKAVYPNFTSRFMGGWQIDGNLGITAAIGEMLLQSREGELNILPALIAGHENGYVTGLKAQGGFEVDIFWREGVLENVSILSRHSKKLLIRYKDRVKEIFVEGGKKTMLTSKDFLVL
ncbi:glycoside hydrolase family 95 protein [Sphingobacterium bambusae]|uniref:Glycoside hydrolase family 95 protein n=1 Tax=Sphingobacterium bambusae TaxID=662858 RepID=A0ABW6BJL0_9SPHI|nr:glycoside hydrolase family 95 protein [Sphingobacterium bambusae]WPL49487.1 glycoside hydrolase family 95 protein [Sphingobacterium bambusae]